MGDGDSAVAVRIREMDLQLDSVHVLTGESDLRTTDYLN